MKAGNDALGDDACSLRELSTVRLVVEVGARGIWERSRQDGVGETGEPWGATVQTLLAASRNVDGHIRYAPGHRRPLCHYVELHACPAPM